MNPFHTALLSALSTKGLTSTHIDTLVDDGFETPSQVLRLSITDLKGLLGIKGGLASDILSVAESAKDSDFGIAQTGTTVLTQTLMENLLGSDSTRTSAVKELLKLGVRKIVVNEDDGILVNETLRLLASPDRLIAERDNLWNDRKLVDVEFFLPDTSPLRSPYGGDLVEGRDIRTDIAWGELPRDRLGLAIWAVQEKMDAGQPQHNVFVDFKTGGALYQRALTLSKVKGNLKEADLRELAKNRNPAPSPKGGTSGSTNPSAALHDLLLQLFSGDELHRFIRWNTDVDTSQLSSGTVSNSKLADEFLIAYKAMYGSFGPEFFGVLCKERPRRKEDIDAVARMFNR